jgi:hypothetical protein
MHVEAAAQALVLGGLGSRFNEILNLMLTLTSFTQTHQHTHNQAP